MVTIQKFEEREYEKMENNCSLGANTGVIGRL